MAKTKGGNTKPKMTGLKGKNDEAVKEKSKSKSKSKAEKVANVTDTNDVLMGTAAEVEGLTQVTALEMAPELINSQGINNFKLGGVLARIQSESWWEGGEHASFKEYVEQVLGLKYRKCMYHIEAYDALVEAGVEWSDVSGIGWSKLRFIVKHITAKNAATWAKRCAKMNALELQEYVKQLEAKAAKKGAKGAEPTVVSVSSMVFKVHPDQKEIIREAVDKKKDELDTDVDAVALENLCIQYVEGTLGKSKKVNKSAVVAYLKGLGEEKAATLLISVYPGLEGKEEEGETDDD